MAKLKLDIDMLRVESFETQTAARGRGTVEGHVLEPGLVIGEPVPATNDVKLCLDSWINTCVTARLSECPGETCNQITCGASCQQTCETCYGPTCVTACLPTCFSGGEVCCA
jgi:hypothetical protein